MCQKCLGYRSMKGNSSIKRGRGRSKGEIKREQSRSYLAHVEQRQNHDFEHGGEQGRQREGEPLMGIGRSGHHSSTQHELYHA